MEYERCVSNEAKLSEISDMPSPTLEAWADSVGLMLGPLVPTRSERDKVLCLLYHYRHLNNTDLKSLLSTDLFTIESALKLASNQSRAKPKSDGHCIRNGGLGNWSRMVWKEEFTNLQSQRMEGSHKGMREP